MKRIYLLAIGIFCCGILLAQPCPPGDIIFKTQQEVDDFMVNYPGCTDVPNNLIIDESSNPNDIRNLNGLSQIVSVQGDIGIYDCDSLNNLTGLENITSINGGLIIDDNDGLTDIAGLQNLISVDGDLIITLNLSLENLTGLGNLTSVGGDVKFSAISELTGLENLTSIGGSLYISSISESLTGLQNLVSIGGSLEIAFSRIENIGGLKNLTFIGGSLEVIYNSQLVDISALSRVDSIGGVLRIEGNRNLIHLYGLENIDYNSIIDLRIIDNDRLFFCSIDNVCDYIQAGNSSFISDNAPGCDDVASIQQFCSTTEDCPPFDLIFAYQQQVDDFPINYPNCTNVSGNIFITGNNTDNITNLNGLSQLDTIQKGLIIRNNDSLSSLAGLENINMVKQLVRIDNNDNLVDLTGMVDLTTGSFYIDDNDNLNSLTGMTNLTIKGSLNIIDNTNLPDLTGMANVNLVGGLSVGGNDNLTNLSGLENADIGGDLGISNNDNLTSLTGLEGLTTINGYVIITNNDNLTDLTGLTNLESIQDDFIISNNNLSDLSGLENLHTIAGDFKIDYPSYWQNDFSIMNFSGLQSLDTIGGSFIIRNASSLMDFTGLDNLRYIGQHLSVSNNTSLKNFNGLKNLDTIVRSFTIEQNANLTDFTGLDNFHYIGGHLSIHNNASLENLNGLDSLNTVQGNVSIFDNDTLTTLLAIENIDLSNIETLEIYNNPNLSVCNTTNICNYLENNGTAQIYNNAPDCSSVSQILFICRGVISCLSQGITFSNQEQIDSFAVNYPDCIAIAGDVIIRGDTSTAITNLSGLSQIEYINGALIIQDNAALTNLNGLEMLTSVMGDLDINNNDALNNLYALTSLTDVQGELIIRNNEILTTLNGLDNITGGGIEYLRIYNNPKLYECAVGGICDYFLKDGYDPNHAQNATVYGNVAWRLYTGDPPYCGSTAEIIYNCPYFLPVELTYFQAQIQNKTTLLTWQTATETQNEGFEIQRSKDGKDWEKIAWQDGQGDSQTPNDYRYVDENPFSGKSYYRLKQVDFDGMFSYSDIVNVNYERSSNISIYPNPTKNTLHIANLNENTIKQIIIYDKMGRQLIVQNDSENTIDVSALSSGIYIIKVKLENGIFCDKFMVK